jgi:hypothetical protein
LPFKFNLQRYNAAFKKLEDKVGEEEEAWEVQMGYTTGKQSEEEKEEEEEGEGVVHVGHAVGKQSEEEEKTLDETKASGSSVSPARIAAACEERAGGA